MLKLGNKYERNFTVNEEVYNGFIAVFKDTNPLHTNEDFAIAKGFKGRVMQILTVGDVVQTVAYLANASPHINGIDIVLNAAQHIN
jgi:acyl dehydratase